MADKTQREPLPRIVKTVRQAQEAAERTRRDGEHAPDGSGRQASHPGGSRQLDEHRDQQEPLDAENVSTREREAERTQGRSWGEDGRPRDRRPHDQRSNAETGEDGRSSGRTQDRRPDPTSRRSDGRPADRQRTTDHDGDSDPARRRDGEPRDRTRDRRSDRDAEPSRSRDHEREPDRGRGPDGGRGDGREADPGRRHGEREADPTGGGGDSSRGGSRREADPTGSDRHADGPEKGRGGRSRASGRVRDLSTFGPLVTHFEGRVTQVFGTSQRTKPSFLPVTLSAAAVALAFALPYVLAWLPVIILVGLAYLWLRRRGWLRGGYRMPKQAGRPDAGLQVTSFRVQIYDDDKKPFRSLDCRIVQSGEAGPAPLVGDEVVVGHGIRLGRGLVELNGLRIGGKKGTRLRAARPSSPASIAFPALVLFGLAGAVLYAEREVLAAFDPRLVVASVVQVLVIVLVIVVLFKFFRSRLRL